MVSDDMVNQNKIFSFKIKGQAKNIFPSDVERTVGIFLVKKFTENERIFLLRRMCFILNVITLCCKNI